MQKPWLPLQNTQESKVRADQAKLEEVFLYQAIKENNYEVFFYIKILISCMFKVLLLLFYLLHFIFHNFYYFLLIKLCCYANT